MFSQSSNGIAQLWFHFGFKVLFRHDNPISSSESYGGPSGTVLKRAIRAGPSFLFEGQDHYYFYYYFFNKTRPHSYSLHTRVLLVLPTSFLTILSTKFVCNTCHQSLRKKSGQNHGMRVSSASPPPILNNFSIEQCFPALEQLMGKWRNHGCKIQLGINEYPCLFFQAVACTIPFRDSMIMWWWLSWSCDEWITCLQWSFFTVSSTNSRNYVFITIWKCVCFCWVFQGSYTCSKFTAMMYSNLFKAVFN